MNSRPYYPLSAFLKERFGHPMRRIGLDAGFTCPNRDGTLGIGGCLFCGEDGARSPYIDPSETISEQLEKGARRIKNKTPDAGIIAYFQAFTNTYGSPERLEELYSRAIDYPGVSALSIGTRPDCLPEDVLEVLDKISRRTFLIVELGIQTLNDEALLMLNRGHGAEASIKAVKLLKNRMNVHVVAQLIFGLPGDDRNSAVSGVRTLNSLGVDGYKFHQLFIEKNTPMDVQYHEGKLKTLDLDEYCACLAAVLPHIRGDAVIHRIMADCPADRLRAPLWTLDKAGSLQYIERYLKSRGIEQGSLIKA